MTATERKELPLFFLIPKVWALDEGNMHSLGGDHVGSTLQCVAQCYLPGARMLRVLLMLYWNSVGNRRSLQKRNPARTANRECKYLEACRVSWVNITNVCSFPALILRRSLLVTVKDNWAESTSCTSR